MMKKTILTLALLPALSLGACSSDPTPVATKGEQLQDLQDAYKDRAITPNEYEEQKEEVLDD